MKKTTWGQRLPALLLALALCLTLLPTAALADDGDFTIENGVLIKYNGPGGAVVIPDGVTKIGEAAFMSRDSDNITSVIIPDGVTEIGKSAFNSCDKMTNVTIPDSVTEIGWRAFFNCRNLVEVTIPRGVTRIGDQVFYYCTRLKSVTIPDSVTEIGSWAFAHTASLTYIIIPDSVTKIEDSFWCGGLTEITIPGSIRTIPSNAFYGCDKLTTIDIRHGVTTIEIDAFAGVKPTFVSFPHSLTTIKGRAIDWNLECTYRYQGMKSEWAQVSVGGGPIRPDHPSAKIMVQCLDGETNVFQKFSDNPICTNHTYNSGVVTKQPTVDAEGVKTYTCTVCGETKTESIPKLEAPKVTFTDVPSWFTTEVDWAAANGIAQGYGNGKFGSDDPCTNAQILTFLWRAEKEPPAKAKSPFTVQSYYQGAVDWAYGEGIIDASFNAGGSCTRAAAMEYIWQALGKQSAAASSFVDVPADAPYAAAVNWGVAKGVTKGFGNNDFQPGKICSRGEIAAFLYRAYN